jgi:hypothetical protein
LLLEEVLGALAITPALLALVTLVAASDVAALARRHGWGSLTFRTMVPVDRSAARIQ